MKTISIKTISFFTLFSFFLTANFVSAHWTPRGGPNGGSVKALAISDTTLFIATAEGGVLRSTSKQGTAWRYANYTGMKSGKINCIAGLGKNIIAGSADSGIFVSNSIVPGDVWTKRNTGLTSLGIGALAVSGTTIYAGTTAGVFISTDTAKTWTPISTGITNLKIVSLVVTGPVLFAGTYGGGVFTSINGGAGWMAANTGLGDTIVNSLLLSGSTIYAGTNKGIFSASAAAPVWSAVNTGFYNNAKVWSIIAYNSNLYSASDYGVYATPEAVINWTKSNTGFADTSATALIVFGTKMFTGTKNTYVYSSPASSLNWTAVPTGFNNLKMSALCAKGTIIAGATNKGVFVSLNDAALYTARNNGLTDSLNVTALEFTADALFAGTKFAGIFMSADTGKSWSAVNMGLTQMHVTDITSDSVTQRLHIGTADSGIFMTSFPSMHWMAMNTGLTNRHIVKIHQGKKYIVALTNNSGVFVYKTGGIWTQSNTGLTNLNATDVASLYNHIFVSTNGAGVFRSDTGTIAWSAKNSGLPSMNIYSLGVTGPYLVTGFKGGVFATYDSAATWLPAGNPLYLPQYSDVRHVAFTTLRQVISTPANSIYSVSKGELPVIPTSVASIDKPENRFEIYPNPSKGKFNVLCTMDEVQFKRLEIYTMTGEKIFEATPADKLASLSLDLTKGIYFLRIQDTKSSSVKKLIIE